MLAQQRFGLSLFAALTLCMATAPASAQSGWMGADYSGTGQSITYQGSASFNTSGDNFFINLFGANSIGNGFDSATFEILMNGNIVDSQSFTTLAPAEAFFSNDFIGVSWTSGLHDIQLAFAETLSRGDGFGFNYGVASGAPEPSTYAMMLIGFVGLGLMAYRRHKKLGSRLTT